MSIKNWEDRFVRIGEVLIFVASSACPLQRRVTEMRKNDIYVRSDLERKTFRAGTCFSSTEFLIPSSPDATTPQPEYSKPS